MNRKMTSGDYVQTWYFAGTVETPTGRCGENNLMFGCVEKDTLKTVTIRWETGSKRRVRRALIDEIGIEVIKDVDVLKAAQRSMRP